MSNKFLPADACVMHIISFKFKYLVLDKQLLYQKVIIQMFRTNWLPCQHTVTVPFKLQH